MCLREVRDQEELLRRARQDLRAGDHPAALHKLRRSAELGSADALLVLYECLMDAGQKEEAAMYMSRYADHPAVDEAGRRFAVTEIGNLMIDRGDSMAAFARYSVGSRMGSAYCSVQCGNLLRASGHKNEAFSMYVRAADEQGCADAYLPAARLATRLRKPPAEIIRLYRAGGRAGQHICWIELGRLLYRGIGATRPSRLRAMEAWQRGAEAGSTSCRIMLEYARCLLFIRRNTQPDIRSLVEMAQGHNLPEAQYYLGRVFHRRGNTEAAISWWKTAATQRHAPSMVMLAKVLFRSNDDLAMQYLRAALALGSPQARRLITRHPQMHP